MSRRKYSSNSTTSIQQLKPWQRSEVPAANGKITAYVYLCCFYSMLHIVRWPLYHRTSNVPMRPHDPRRNPRVFYTNQISCLFHWLYFCLAVCISSSRDRQRFSPDSKLITAHYNFIIIHRAEPPRQRYKSRRSEKSGRDARMCHQINCAVRGKCVSHKGLFWKETRRVAAAEMGPDGALPRGTEGISAIVDIRPQVSTPTRRQDT